MSALVPVPAAALDARPREGGGWRAGRPVEDPEKMKRWGFVSAKPSEYLVHVKRGRVTKRSGQGASCFKWPWDSVAIVPTSLQRLGFRADQVTSEKIGVEVVGLAVYRIADPLLAFRVLNFSFPERAQEKLEETLTAMFVGATRRLVATLTVEECLQKRKSALAEELLREIAPVVGGEGRPEDGTDRGWGVVIDTIEIQEVRVLSEAVFIAMQAPTRAALEQRARDARAEAEKVMATHQAACEREVEEARIVAQEAVEQLRAAAARKAAEAHAADALRRGARSRAPNQDRTIVGRGVDSRAAGGHRRRAGRGTPPASAQAARARRRADAHAARHA
jgi:flotillin